MTLTIGDNDSNTIQEEQLLHPLQFICAINTYSYFRIICDHFTLFCSAVDDKYSSIGTLTLNARACTNRKLEKKKSFNFYV